MDLDDLTKFHSLDSSNLISQINRLPQQLLDAWKTGNSLPLPQMDGLKNIVVAGMGGSAIGADLLAAYARPLCPLPVVIHRDYDLPAWARGSETLLIASSYSGDTEEVLSAFKQAQARGCRILLITTGGRLDQAGVESQVPTWRLPHLVQPRVEVGYSFGLLLAAFYRLGLMPDPTAELQEALRAVRGQQAHLLPGVPVALNPAKRMAGQLVGRWVTVFAADPLGPVALRWKTMINENAKAWAQAELLPEADHNTVVGSNNPEGALMQMLALFLSAPSNHPRNQLRLELTRQIFLTQGINTDQIQAVGKSRMAHIWTLLHFGDYTSYYLAMEYQEDPAPVELLTGLKAELGKTEST